METLKIQIPEGFKIESFDISTGECKLCPMPKDIKEMIQNFSDVLKYHGIDEDDFNEEVESMEEDEIAYKQLKLIVSAYNEKETPDYDNSNQVKYEPRFKLSSSGSGFSSDGCANWLSYSYVGSRLCFLNYENLKDATSKFLTVYQTFYSNKSK